MKYYSEFSEQYVQDICNALNDVGVVMDKFTNRQFTPENLETITDLLQNYVVRSLDYFTLLDNKGLVNRGRCPYTGQRIDNSFPSWSFMNNRRVYLSHEGFKIMKKEADEEYERIYGSPRPVQNNSNSKTGGCYIATVCYGSETAPEVISLKNFRDEILSKSLFGRLFIKIYYALSPYIAEKMKNKNRLNNIIRSKLLDKIVKRIK